MNSEDMFPRLLSVRKGELRPRFMDIREDLDRRIKEAEKMLEDCALCEHICGVDRSSGQVGFCRVGDRMSISAHYAADDHDHAFLTPSMDIFFLGCVLRCEFCHNPDTSQVKEPRLQMTERYLAKLIGSRSFDVLDLVGGDPIPQIPSVLRLLKHLETEKAVMFNSSFYMTSAALDLLEGAVDICTPDLKFGNDDCAKKLSRVDGYSGVIQRNILQAAADTEVMIRHLILPGHIDCCSVPVIDWVYENCRQVPVNILSSYSPYWRARKHEDINRELFVSESDQVVEYAKDKKLRCLVDF